MSPYMGSKTRFILSHYIRPKVRQDKQRTCKCNNEARARNHCSRGKAINITYSECVFLALGIQHANRLHGIILSSLACQAAMYCST